MKNTIKELKNFLFLWSTQSLSQLGSAMTGYALTLWLYEETGSALQTALLAICTYVPYVLMSIFAGALSDKWDKKKIMLISDVFAALGTVTVLILLKCHLLIPIHLYILNVLSGLMNTIQQPASEVASTLIVPKKHYQKTSGLGNMTRSLVTILNPLIATAVFSFAGIEAVIYIDLISFLIAFLTLLFIVKIPNVHEETDVKKESFFETVKGGLRYLNENRMILVIILFMASVNLIASAFDAVLPALILPKGTGGETVLGMVTSCSGIAMLVGSLVVTVLPKPKNRIRVIYLTMLFSLGTENYLLAFSESPVIWCIGQILGWLVVPIMSANQDVIMRTTVPVEMQGRVYSCRNSLQFFTIPIGLLLGGFFVDEICEPIMAQSSESGLLTFFFGTGKGSGASLMMFILGIAGTVSCLAFGKILNKYTFED